MSELGEEVSDFVGQRSLLQLHHPKPLSLPPPIIRLLRALKLLRFSLPFELLQ